jgi:hypothetical protein
LCLGVGHAGQGGPRRVEDLFEPLVLIRLVEALGQIDRNGHDVLAVSARQFGGAVCQQPYLTGEREQAEAGQFR